MFEVTLPDRCISPTHMIVRVQLALAAGEIDELEASCLVELVAHPLWSWGL